MKSNVTMGCSGIAVSIIFASGAQAGFVDLAGGWRASWDASLDPFVDIQDNGVVNAQGVQVQVIQKSAEFTQGPQIGGLFPSIPITFTQTDPNAVNFIAIDDEIITNSTGVDWTDFHFEILDGNDAFFDDVRTANSGGGPPIGFFIEPFQQATFSPDLQELDVFDGVVPSGTQWFPGDGATDGQLWMSMNTGDGVNTPFTTFTLKETPTPTPGAMALLGLGGLAAARRRR